MKSIKYKLTKLSILLLPLFMLFNSTSCSQSHKLPGTPEWMRFTKGNYIKTIELQEEYVWMTTSTSLLKFNIETEKFTEYNNLNSPIPSNIILSLFIDKKGVKWLGTYNGLVKFDDSTWQIYNKDNSELKSNHIIGITGDSKENIWLWTEMGIVKYNGTTWTNFKDSKIHAKTTGLFKNPIYADKNDNIWIGGFNYIVKFDGKDWTTYDYFNTNLRFSKINSIKEDQNGSIWFATSMDGLLKYNNEKWEQIDRNTYPTMKSGFIKSIDFDSSGNIWLGTIKGLALFDGAKFKYFKSHMNYALAVKIDKNETKWISTRQDYLIKFNNDKFQKFKTSKSLIPSNEITSIQIGTDNSKWISTHYNGIVKIKNNNIKAFNSGNSKLPSNTILYLAIDNKNTKWIASLDEFTSYNDKSFKIYNYKDLYGFISKKMEIQKNGTIWLLTYENKLLNFDRKSVKSVKIESLHNQISDFSIDNNDNIWVSSPYEIAVYKLDDNNWVKYNNKNTELPENGRITSIVFDKSNNLWIATSDKGLLKFDGKNKCDIFSTENSEIPNNYPKHLAFDNNGNIWFISNSKLVKYDGITWKIFENEKTKLPQKIVSIKIDKFNNLWIATSYGLYVFNENGIDL